jgi:hypothetical protein
MSHQVIELATVTMSAVQAVAALVQSGELRRIGGAILRARRR